jgi:hypothetical protein
MSREGCSYLQVLIELIDSHTFVNKSERGVCVRREIVSFCSTGERFYLIKERRTHPRARVGAHAHDGGQRDTHQREERGAGGK